MYKFPVNNFFNYSVILFPITYIIGVFITEIFLFFITLFFFIQNRNLDLFKDYKFIFLFLISVYIGVNAFFQIDDELKISSIFHFRYIIFSISILFCLKYFENFQYKKKNNLLYVYFFIITLVLFDAFFQFLYGENLLGYEISKNRISGIFETELILGSYLLKILPIITWLLFYKNFDIKKNEKNLIIFFSFYFFCIFLTGERTSFGLSIFFIILIIFLIHSLKKIFLYSLVNLSILISVIFFFNIGKTDPTKRIFVKTFNQFTNQYFIKEDPNKLSIKDLNNKKEIIKDNILIFSKDHTGHYKLAFEIFKKNPIFGVGPKGFRHYCRKVNYDPQIGICSTHPHNFLVQITTETGLIGLFFYCYIIFFLVLKLIKCAKIKTLINNRLSLIIISIGLLINLFPFLPSGNFFNNWISIINYYFLGIYFYSYNKVYN